MWLSLSSVVASQHRPPLPRINSIPYMKWQRIQNAHLSLPMLPDIVYNSTDAYSTVIMLYVRWVSTASTALYVCARYLKCSKQKSTQPSFYRSSLVLPSILLWSTHTASDAGGAWRGRKKLHVVFVLLGTNFPSQSADKWNVFEWYSTYIQTACNAKEKDKNGNGVWVVERSIFS